jgi:hypothetical protein
MALVELRAAIAIVAVLVAPARERAHAGRIVSDFRRRLLAKRGKRCD